jgi:hypothetical protein
VHHLYKSLYHIDCKCIVQEGLRDSNTFLAVALYVAFLMEHLVEQLLLKVLVLLLGRQMRYHNLNRRLRHLCWQRHILDIA